MGLMMALAILPMTWRLLCTMVERPAQHTVAKGFSTNLGTVSLGWSA